MLLSFSLTASSSSNRDSSSSVEGSNVARFSGKKSDNSYAEIAIGLLELLTAYLANTLFFFFADDQANSFSIGIHFDNIVNNVYISTYLTNITRFEFFYFDLYYDITM